MGRELTFSDKKIIAIVKENFIAVAADDWFQRRRQDAEGEFFRKIADQGPRNSQGGTRQGIYAFTADGTLLQYRNAQDPDVMRGFLLSALEEWQNLPAKMRAKGAVKVSADPIVDPRYARTLPKDGMIVNVYGRILDRENNFFCHGTCKFPGGQRASHDHMWLRADEWRALAPKDSKVGQVVEIPAKLLFRLVRFHLLDNTRGEPPLWGRSEIRKGDFKLVVTEVTAKEIRLELTADVLLSTGADVKSAKRGYDAAVRGELRYDVAASKFTKFNIVALGEHWGEGTYTGGARPGRTPFGVAFELADPNRAADRVPPQAIREGGAYYDADR